MFPMPSLSLGLAGGAGGAAGPANGGGVGSVANLFGDFQVGGAGNVAANPQTATQPTTNSPSQATGGATTLSEMMPWLVIAGAALIAVYLLKHH